MGRGACLEPIIRRAKDPKPWLTDDRKLEFMERGLLHGVRVSNRDRRASRGYFHDAKRTDHKVQRHLGGKRGQYLWTGLLQGASIWWLRTRTWLHHHDISWDDDQDFIEQFVNNPIPMVAASHAKLWVYQHRWDRVPQPWPEGLRDCGPHHPFSRDIAEYADYTIWLNEKIGYIPTKWQALSTMWALHLWRSDVGPRTIVHSPRGEPPILHHAVNGRWSVQNVDAGAVLDRRHDDHYSIAYFAYLYGLPIWPALRLGILHEQRGKHGTRSGRVFEALGRKEGLSGVWPDETIWEAAAWISVEPEPFLDAVSPFVGMEEHKQPRGYAASMYQAWYDAAVDKRIRGGRKWTRLSRRT